MAIAFCSIQVSDFSDDLACSSFAAYADRCNHPVSASARTDHKHRYGGESALRPSTPPLGVLSNEVFSQLSSYGERPCEVSDLKQHLRDRIRLLPTTLSARQYRKLIEDWVHGRIQPGVSPIVAVHVTDHDAGRRCPCTIWRRG